MPDVPATPPVLRPLQVALAAQRAGLLAYVDRRLPASLRSWVDPADVVQDVCCEALRREGHFRPGDDPTGRRWLFTIARRRIIRLLERARVARQLTECGLGAAAGMDPLAGLLEQLAVYERTPSQSAASHERMAAVQRALARLSPDHAVVIRLRYVDRLPAAVVAGRIARSPAAVDKLLQRAVAALRVELRSLIAAHG
jgi:RNA polymerase sigma factor (sigma-70 family)